MSHCNLPTDENAIRTKNPLVKSSSLRLSEKFLISLPHNRFASFLLSLVHILLSRPIDATISLLDIFVSDPSLARSEIAPKVFEELFLVHFISVLDWFNDKRAKIMPMSITNSGYGLDDQDGDSVVLPSLKLLSKMSGDQTSHVKKLEREYSEVLNQNCRVFAQYFRDVLANRNNN